MLATNCQTPGLMYDIAINARGINIDVYPASKSNRFLGQVDELTEDQAKLLEATLHNALELVLAPFFARRNHD